MKNRIIITVLLSLIASLVQARSNPGDTLALRTVPEGYELVDSIIYRPVSAVDTALVLSLIHI